MKNSLVMNAIQITITPIRNIEQNNPNAPILIESQLRPVNPKRYQHQSLGFCVACSSAEQVGKSLVRSIFISHSFWFWPISGSFSSTAPTSLAPSFFSMRYDCGFEALVQQVFQPATLPMAKFIHQNFSEWPWLPWSGSITPYSPQMASPRLGLLCFSPASSCEPYLPSVVNSLEECGMVGAARQSTRSYSMLTPITLSFLVSTKDQPCCTEGITLPLTTGNTSSYCGLQPFQMSLRPRKLLVITSVAWFTCSSFSSTISTFSIADVIITQGNGTRLYPQQLMINTTSEASNGPGISVLARCLSFFGGSEALALNSVLMPRLCACAPSHTASMCHEAEKWLFHIPDSDPHKIVSGYARVIPSYSLADDDEVAVVIHKHCKHKFSCLRKSKRQQQALERVLRRMAGELRVRKVQPYNEVYGWLAAQLLYHAGEPTAHHILRHLVLSMRLYDDDMFEEGEALSLEKMRRFIPQALEIVHNYNISIMEIIRHHSNSLFAENIPENMMGWLVTEYLKNGWESFVDMMCSFVDNRLDKNTAESRQELWKLFLTGSDVEWPWVFCNMNMKEMD